MATKTAPEPKADEKPKDPVYFPPIASGTDDNGLNWEDVSVFGTVYRIRQITTEEDDAAWDAAELPNDRYNNRLLARMQLVASIVSPATTLDDIGRMSKIKVQSLFYVHNRLNSLPPADTEGNA